MHATQTDTLAIPANFGSISARAVRVGTFVLDEPTVYRTTEQTACNWREITVPAGEYEITTNGYWFYVKLAGVKTDEHFVNRVFTASAIAPKRGIGEPATYHRQGYDYDLAQLAVSDPEHYRLDEGWTVRVRQWTSEHADYRTGSYQRVSFGLVPPPTGEQ